MKFAGELKYVCILYYFRCSALLEFGGVLASLRSLKRCGFNPTNVLDVGANNGQWSRTLKKSVFEKATFTLIEGNEDHKEALESTGYEFIISLVGSEVKNVTYFKIDAGTGTGNGIFFENTRYSKSAISRKVVPIDVLFSSKNGSRFYELVKFDIQGSEVAGIKGARETLKKTEVIITDAPVMNYNEGAPSFFDLHLVLHRMGFSIYNIADPRYHHGILLQYDIIWASIDSPLWNQSCTSFPKPKRFISNQNLSES